MAAAPLVQCVQELLTTIVHAFTCLYGPLLVVLDDVHNFDTASWLLLAHMAQHAPAVLVVGALRPNDGILTPVPADTEVSLRLCGCPALHCIT